MAWSVKRLGDVCHLVGGGTPPVSNGDFYNGTIPWATVRDMHSERLVGTERYITDEAVRSSTTKVIPSGNVIFATRVGLGKVCLLDQDTAINQDLRAAIPKQSSTLDKSYLFRWFQSVAPTLRRAGTGATVQGVKISFVEALQIPLPALSTQKRIVAILDEAFAGIDAAITNMEKNLHNVRGLLVEFRESIFAQKGPAWIEKKFAEIASIKHGFPFQSRFFGKTGNHILLTPGNFYETGGYRDRGKKQKRYTGPVPDGYVLPKGAMLLAMTEQAAGLLGSPAIVPEEGVFLHNQRLGLVVPHIGTPWCNDFFFHAFNTIGFRKKVHNDASGVKVRHTSPQKLGSVTLAFPQNLAEQADVANKLDACRGQTFALERNIQQKLTALAELKQSILQKAFTGELTAKVADQIMEAA